MDHLIFKKLWPWATRRHPKKSWSWIADKYWQHRDCAWTFGFEGNITLHKLAAIAVRRHVKVEGSRSPFDGDAIYWSTRMGSHPELKPSLARM